MSAGRRGHDRIRRAIRDFLRDKDVEWEIVTGGKHDKLFVNGRMICVLSRGGTKTNHDSGRPAVEDTIQLIKRALRQING